VKFPDDYIYPNFGGGSGSSGGGGSSGAVSYPAYLETVHSAWIDATGTVALTQSLAATMNTGFGNSPWLGLAAYDPDADIAAYDAVLTAFKAILAGISETADWATMYAQAKTTINNAVDIAADVAAFSSLIDDEITTKVLPRFRRGMQDINAVVSSAFPIGEAIIEAFRDRDVAKYSTGIMVRNYDLLMTGTEQMIKLMLQRVSWEEGYAKIFIEGKRIKIVAKKEQTDQDAKLDEEDALWDIEMFQYGGNLLAAIGGGVSAPNTKKPSQAQSMIGGALSGATAGAMVGGAPGAVIGGILGMASSFL